MCCSELSAAWGCSFLHTSNLPMLRSCFHPWGGAVAPAQTRLAQGRNEWRAQLGPPGQEGEDLEMTVHLWMLVEGGKEARWGCWNLNEIVLACLCSFCSLCLSLHSLAQTLQKQCKAGRTPSLGGDLITTRQSLKDHSLQVNLWHLWWLSPLEQDHAGNWFHSSLVLAEIVLRGQENIPVSQHESAIHSSPASPAVPGSPAQWWAARIKDWLSSVTGGFMPGSCRWLLLVIGEGDLDWGASLCSGFSGLKIHWLDHDCSTALV